MPAQAKPNYHIKAKDIRHAPLRPHIVSLLVACLLTCCFIEVRDDDGIMSACE